MKYIYSGKYMRKNQYMYTSLLYWYKEVYHLSNLQIQYWALMVKVCALQPLDRGVQTPHGSQPWFLIWHQNWLVPGSGLYSDLSKLWELASQACKNK